MKMKIALISDTHGALAMTQKIIQREEADMVLHMGDVGFDPHYLGQVYYVKGNHDEELQEPKEKLLTIENRTIFMTHGDLQELEVFTKVKEKHPDDWFQMEWCIEEYLEVLHDLGRRKQADVVCFGHTHQPIIKAYEDCLMINPGSLALPFDGKRVSYAVLYIERDYLHAELKYHPYDEK